MRTITSKLNEKIKINNEITISVVAIGDNDVRIGIDAPKSVKIKKTELSDKMKDGSFKTIESGNAKPVNVSKQRFKKVRSLIFTD